jgi:hypothetical protein
MRIILSSSRDTASREAVGVYLRTGILPADRPEDVETKFNPWHDLLGRFTFKNGGSTSGDGSQGWGGGGFTGPGGGGDGFDGAGASASWDPAPSRSPEAGKTSARPKTGIVASAAAASAPEASWHSVVRNGYTYQLDAADRTRQVTGTLALNTGQSRSRGAQAGAGGSDRLPTDDGGHYIARRFDGPTDTFNHFAQDANFNRGGYRVLESGWANDIKAGKQVYVAITPTYDGSSKRPSAIRVVYSVNGSRETRTFPNGSKGKSHGK